MRKYSRVTDIGRLVNKSAVALGTFDGVHLGHQKIIGQAVELARQRGGSSVVFTFSNHPLSVIDPKRCPPQILTPKYKAQLVESLGVDVLLDIPFTKQFLELSPEDFITQLVANLHPAFVVVGPNYSYGHRGAGTPETLTEAGERFGFQAIIHPAVYKDGALVSSTLIRQLIQEGKVTEASALLGRPHRLTGKVITGDGRGHVLGFPTANVSVMDGLVMPGDGVYAAYAHVDSKKYRAVANMGTNPTFDIGARRLEVFLLDFNGNLYGKNMQVDILAKLRDEQRFESADSLVAQIASDIKTAQFYFK